MQILTSKGFREFDGVISNGRVPVGTLSVADSSIRCTADHQICTGREWQPAAAFPCFMLSSEEEVFDAVNVRDGHEYLTNGIPSHNCIYLDEFAHVERDVEFWTSTFPTISSGFTTRVIITSTPKGMNLFYKLWKESEDGKNPFKAYFFPWTEHPLRNAKWEKEQLQALGAVKFKQEVGCIGADSIVTVRDKITGEIKRTSIGSLHHELNMLNLERNII